MEHTMNIGPHTDVDDIRWRQVFRWFATRERKLTVTLADLVKLVSREPIDVVLAV